VLPVCKVEVAEHDPYDPYHHVHQRLGRQHSASCCEPVVEQEQHRPGGQRELLHLRGGARLGEGSLPPEFVFRISTWRGLPSIPEK